MNDNDRSIVGFTMIGHAMVHTYELSIPILMTIWLLEFSTTAATLGYVVTIGYGLFGVGALPGGILVDRYGSRALICACLAGMGLSFLLVSLTPGILALAVALGIWGIAASVYHPAGLTLISNGVRDRGAGFAYHGMAGNIGIALGPLATALLLVAFDWRLVAAALAIPSLAAAAAGLVIKFDETAAVESVGIPDGGERDDGGDGGGERRDGSENESEDRDATRSPTSADSLAGLAAETRRLFTVAFLTVFVVVTFSGLYYRGVLTFLPDLLGNFLETAVGDSQLLFDPESPMAEEFDLAQYLYVGLLVVGIAGQYVGGRLVDAVEPDRGLAVVFVALVVIALVFVPTAQAGLWPLLAVSVVLGFVLFALQPLEQATIAKYSRPDTRGLSFGYTYLAIFGIGALGAAIVGTVLTYASPSVMFVVLAGFAGVACLLALSLGRRDDPGEW
ncbi:MFS transporter [Natronoglomus mannanivorans]|uniref:MFS transporter n=1 Tax=Natronoglomus mannanivorans TaxID=2979990 RepID=A0AAP2YXY7_9EURY|nr:MFS transporter [Halobacteria archaeon AArc-xg1-1]